MNKFTLGVVAGVSSLALAVPVLAQLSLAATDEDDDVTDRPVPSQECVAAHAAQEDTMLSTMDTMHAAHKSAMQAHQDALEAAAAITDEAARGAALEAAHTAMRDAMETAMEGQSDMTDTMEAVKAACGDELMLKGPGGRGHAHGMMMKAGLPGMKMFFHGKLPPGDAPAGDEVPATGSAAAVD